MSFYPDFLPLGPISPSSVEGDATKPDEAVADLAFSRKLRQAADACDAAKKAADAEAYARAEEARQAEELAIKRAMRAWR